MGKDIVDAVLKPTLMFRKDMRKRRGGGIIVNTKESIHAYEIILQSKADCEEATWRNKVTNNSTLTIGVVHS